MNYYNEIKNKLIDNEIYSKVKDYSKERHKVITYYETGKLLYEAGSIYGEDIIGQYSLKLMNEVGKKYNKSTLFRIRKFYIIFSSEKVAPLVPQLTWSHCLILIPIKNIDKINYYIQQISLRNLSKRQLQDIIKKQEYERLPKETKNKLTNQEGYYNLKARLPYSNELNTANQDNLYLYENLDYTTWIGNGVPKPSNSISGIYGYWTFESARPTGAQFLWSVGGVTGHYEVHNNNSVGVRPVITLGI